jgi:hypothetical protein
MVSDLPHVHYCKDVADSKVCFERGYCECDCGARAPLKSTETTEYQKLWVMPGEGIRSEPRPDPAANNEELQR